MPVLTTIRTAGPFGHGSIELPFPFRVFSTAEVRVTRTGTATGEVSVLSLGSDYTVSLTADGGIVRLATPIPAGHEVFVVSNIPNTQPAMFTSSWVPSALTNALDRATMQVQQLAEGQVGLPPVSVRASRFLAFDAVGTPIAALGPPSVPATTFAGTLLDDTSAAMARTTLGATAVGHSLFTAASPAAAQTSIGATPVGSSLLTAATAGAARQALDITPPTPALWITNGRIGLAAAGSALTVSLLTHAGASPAPADAVGIIFPQGTGQSLRRSVTSALPGLVVPPGATLGHISGITCPVYVYLLDFAGVAELAVSHAFHGSYGVITTQAVGAASTDSASMYSGSARTNVPHVCLGRWGSTQTTAGTWAVTTGPQQLFPWPWRAPLITTIATVGTANWARHWDALTVRAQVQGGGGGGGGTVSTTTGQAAFGYGGGAGGYAEGLWPAHLVSALAEVTVGAAGVGAAAAAAGTSGGSSSFGAALTATGGAGGPRGEISDVNTVIHTNAAPGGLAAGGHLRAPGDPGTHGAIYSVTVVQGVRGGAGGQSPLGSPGRAMRANSHGEAASGHGAGGSGGASIQGAGNATGGAGAPGVVIITETF